jgi:hypothetical protein
VRVEGSSNDFESAFDFGPARNAAPDSFVLAIAPPFGLVESTPAAAIFRGYHGSILPNNGGLKVVQSRDDLKSGGRPCQWLRAVSSRRVRRRHAGFNGRGVDHRRSGCARGLFVYSYAFAAARRIKSVDVITPARMNAESIERRDLHLGSWIASLTITMQARRAIELRPGIAGMMLRRCGRAQRA